MAAAGGAGAAAADAFGPTVSKLRGWVESSAAAGELTAQEAAWADEHTCRRYVVARGGDYESSLKMLRGTLTWRRTAISEPLHCPRCCASPRTAPHCFIPLGLDMTGSSVVVYGNPPRASETCVEDTVRHVVHYLEHSWHGAEGGVPAGSARWTWVVDFNGFGFSHAMQAKLGISFASMFADHFPERLHRLIMINTPTVFNMLLGAIRPFADARTMSKIVSISGDAPAIAAKLAELDIPAVQRDWVQQVLTMAPTPGNVPPLPEGAESFTPHSPACAGPHYPVAPGSPKAAGGAAAPTSPIAAAPPGAAFS